MKIKKMFYLFVFIISMITLASCGDIIADREEKFSVAFVTNCDLTVESQSVENGSYATKPSISRPGYTLEGWFIDVNFTSEFIFETTPITKSTTLYAQWSESIASVSQFTVTFNSNGGSTVTDVVVDQGADIIAPTNPTKSGFSFIGWYTDAALVNIYSFNTPVNSSFVLYAKWESVAAENQFTVTFNSNGGSTIANQVVNANSTVTKPTNPTKSGYVFDGWYTNSQLTTAFNFETPITANIELFAKWTAEAITKFTVTFNSNGGSSVTSASVNANSTVTKPTNPTKSGFIFDGWFTEASCTNSFNFSTPITANTELFAKWTPETGGKFIVTFVTNSTSSIASQSITEGLYASVPISPTKDGYVFNGWFTDSECKNSFNFNTAIYANTTLYAKWIAAEIVDPAITGYGAFNESLYAEWNETNKSMAKAYYKLSSDSSWSEVDTKLIRNIDGAKARVDVVGIKAGLYDLKIVDSQSNELIVSNLTVQAYDRSGYAHFNYTAGIGAYKDDGTLKDDAIVIYVTNENKDTITIPGVKDQVGLGWILNNRQYSCTDDNGKPTSNTYDLTKAQNSISNLGKPLCIRFIGTIDAPAGLTAYNSTDNGGSVGDNGFMARMKDASNVTIEGIGENAVIRGWGFHFMASTAGKGISFEVRNLTFDKYPEDAIGMEGVQKKVSGVDTLTAPVERCWIHNNTFLSGYAANPTESDKAAGDGSCDFKRGQYYTLSYNYFEKCKKTNLIGASDSNLQFNITMHHNWWRDCESRMPLTRQANVHMYNNYFEITDKCASQPSYMQNTRANAYIYSEANYFQAGKNSSRVDGGAIKSYNDVKYSCFDSDGATVVTDRTTTVASGNKYANFDTNSNTFYYNSATKTSNVTRLTDAVTAKAECIAFSGVNKADAIANYNDAKITTIAPTTLTESRAVTSETKIGKGTPALVFTINTSAIFTMVSTSSPNAVLVDIYGRTMLLGSGSVNLEAGTYVLESAQAHGASKGTSQAKEAKVASYSITFDSKDAKEARIKAAKDAFDALPTTISYNSACHTLIVAARSAFDLLKSDEKSEVNLSILTSAEAAYNAAGVTYIETLINDIGVVTSTSYSKINAARSAYNAASATIKSNISNYDTLLAAELAFEAFAIQNVIDLIDALAAPSTATNKESIQSLLAQYYEALDAYNGLDDEGQKSEVTNFAKLSSGIAELEALALPYEVIDLIAGIDLSNITLSNSSDLVVAHTTYNTLTAAQKAVIPAEYVTKLESAWSIYNSLLSQAISHNFSTDGTTSNFFTISGSLASGKGTVVVNGETLNTCLKIESKTVVSFTTTTKMTLNLYFLPGNKIKIGTQTYTADSNGLISVQLEAGSYSLGRVSEVYLFYMELFPAA